MSRSIRLQALAACAVAVLANAHVAQAQEAAAGGSDVSEVVVTGSRVIRDGYAAPTPVTVVTTQQMQLTAPTSLSDALNQLPSFKNSFTPSSTGFLVGAGGGGAFLNLRGLSAKRNLVLLDGRRLVQSSVVGSVAGATDLNILPQALVSRVDVVTGGASAAYGSDAVSGVINFVLDTKFTGIKIDAQAGVSDQGDNENWKLALAFGAPFAGDRGHVVVAAEFVDNKGVEDFSDRDWAKHGYAVISTRTPASGQTSTANPTRVIAADVRPANMASAGLITSGPLAGNYFNASGGVTPFPFGTLRTATTMSGGGIDPDFGVLFSNIPPQTRGNAFIHATYDLTPDWSVFAEGMFADARTNYRGILSSSATHQPYTIFRDNAYLTPAVRAALGATPSFTLGRIDTDFPFHREFSVYNTLRAVAGIDGAIGGWKVNAYYTHGRAEHETSSTGNANLSRLFDAVDAVVAPAGIAGITPGSIVCRTSLASPGNGCLPLNVLGPNTANPAAVAWITGAASLRQVLTQDVVDFAVRGDPFTLWAGPVSFGAGATYRKEHAVAFADPVSSSYNPAIPGTTAFKPGLTPVLAGNIARFPAALRGQLGGYETANTGALDGGYNVKEVFGEVLVPLLKDVPFAQNLDFNGAVRYADYSTSGGVTSWKAGLTWTVVDGLRLRGTRSRDVRAANLAELYQGVSQSNPAVLDPFRGNENNVGAITRNFGNTTLLPEQGDTWTVGVVLQPRFMPGFSASVDYYKITLSNAIAQLGGQVIVNQCFSGATDLCGQIARNTDPTTFGAFGVGPILSVDNQFLNVGTTRTEGVDFDIAYRTPVDRFLGGVDGALTGHALVNYVRRLDTVVRGATTITSSAGVVGGTFPSGAGGTPHWSGSFSLTYETGPLTVFLQERFIGGGRNQANVDEEGNPLPATAPYNANPTQNGLVPNKVPAVWYTDMTLNYKFGKTHHYEAFLTVNNLLDKDPPAVPTFFFYGTLATNYQLYDVLGRNYTAGVRFRF